MFNGDCCFVPAKRAPGRCFAALLCPFCHRSCEHRHLSRRAKTQKREPLKRPALCFEEFIRSPGSPAIAVATTTTAITTVPATITTTAAAAAFTTPAATTITVAAAATAVAIATTSPSAATWASAAATAEAARRAFFLGSGFHDLDGAPAQILAVQAANGRSSFRIVGHFNKAKATGTTAFAVCDDTGAGHNAVGFEGASQLGIVDRVSEVAHIEVHYLIRTEGLFAMAQVVRKHSSMARNQISGQHREGASGKKLSQSLGLSSVAENKKSKALSESARARRFLGPANRRL